MSDGNPTPSGEATQTVEQKVNEVLTQVVTEEGNFDWDKIPKEELTEDIKFAVIAEKRRRDTQSDYTRKAQELARLKAQNKVLAEQVKETANISLTTEQQEELEALKWKDPDSYAEKLIQYRDKAHEDTTKELQAKLKEAEKQANEEAQIAIRQQILNDFNNSNPDKPLTTEMLNTSVPVSLVNKLQAGEIDFTTALKEAHVFVYGDNKVANSETPNQQPSLGDVGNAGGTNEVPNKTKNEDIIW